MKIRSDFVTNSSSSSYCVSFSVKLKGNNEEAVLDFWPDDEDGSGEVYIPSLLKSTKLAEKIAKCKTIEELRILLLTQLDPSSFFDDEINSDATIEEIMKQIENLDNEDYEDIASEVLTKYENFKASLESVNSLDDVESVTIDEHRYAWGEFAPEASEEFLDSILLPGADLKSEDVDEIVDGEIEDFDLFELLDKIENCEICCFDANSKTTIHLSDKSISKTHYFEDLA